MAISKNFAGIEIKFPSWSGTRKCQYCGGRGWSQGGKMPNGKPGFSSGCMDCKRSASYNWPKSSPILDLLNKILKKKI